MLERVMTPMQLAFLSLAASFLLVGTSNALVDERTVKPAPSIAPKPVPAEVTPNQAATSSPAVPSQPAASFAPVPKAAPSTPNTGTNPSVVRPKEASSTSPAPGLGIPVPEAPPPSVVTTKTLDPQEAQERVARAPISIDANDQGTVSADMSSPAWQGEYPGPFGSMRLAEALIAQIVPISGGPVELDIPAKMLTRYVTIQTGMTRQVTLQDMARVHKINLTIVGKKVSVRDLEQAPVAVAPKKTSEPVSAMTSGASPTAAAPATPTPATTTGSTSTAGATVEKKTQDVPSGITITTIPAAAHASAAAPQSVTAPGAENSSAATPTAATPTAATPTANAARSVPLGTKKIDAQTDKPVAPSEPVAIPVAPVKVTKRWELPAGSMLSACLEKWAKTWGWKVLWRVDKDFRIASSVEIDDDFLGGVARVLEAYRATRHPLWGDAHDGQKLLVITSADGSAQSGSSR